MMLGEVPEPVMLHKVMHSWLQENGRLLNAESIFDPHYIRRAKLRKIASASGLIQSSVSGNIFG